MEHMRSPNPLLGVLMDIVNPLNYWLNGDHLNRRTIEDIRAAGLVIERITNEAMGGIFKQLELSVEK
jgi:hypothetical protein